MGVGDAGEPIAKVAFAQQLLAVGSAPIMPPAIDVGAGVARIVQRPDRGRNRQRPEDRQLLVAPARWEAKPFLAKRLDRLAGGPDARERFEEIRDCLPDLRVGVEHRVAGLIIGEAGRQRTAVLATADFVQDLRRAIGL